MIYVHVCDLQCPKMPLIIEELKHKARMEIEIIFPYKLNISFKVSFKKLRTLHMFVQVALCLLNWHTVGGERERGGMVEIVE